MKDALQIVALILGFLGIVSAVFSLYNNYWRESTTEGSVITTSTIFENLWMSCADDSSGVYNCWNFQSLLALPAIVCYLKKTHLDALNRPGRFELAMDSFVEALAVSLGFGGWVMVGVALTNRYWRLSAVDGNVITTTTIYENLWMSCATNPTGVHNCREFPSLLSLSGYIQACRALMITSIVLGIFGLVATLVGMQCSKVGGENYVMKGRVAGVGGIFFILQGLCTMIAVSWYAYNITQQFFDPLYPGIKYEIGDGLYIGWSSATLALCGGSCLLCSCRVRNSDEKKSDLQNYITSDYTRHMQITQTASTISCSSSSQYERKAYV